MWFRRRQLKPFEKLQEYWLDSGADLQTTVVSEEAVAAVERRYSVLLPKDFREYLLKSSPLDRNHGSYVDWWSLDRIKNIPEEYKYKVVNTIVAKDASTYLFFADYLIWCWAWAIACGDDQNRGRIVVINGVTDRYVADSFGQFVDRYIKDEQSIA